ncbi:MAG: ferritin family protein [Peptostreptococcaceae bacterium]|nr:ferritin family protein [Peptostreptococcaceae bacterium]
MNRLEDILKYAMAMELRAKEFYTFYKDKVQNKSIKLMFEGLSAMEDEHYEILNDQLKNLQNNKQIAPLDLDVNAGNDIVDSKASELAGLSEDFDVSELPILRMAYAMENDFAVYYQNAAKEVEDPAAKELLETLAKWEIKHRDDFAREVDQALQNSWFSQGFAPF